MEFRGKLGRLGVAALALAMVAGGTVFASSTAQAQSPQGVPAARFYGNVRLPSGNPPTNLTITASSGSTVCSGTQSIPQSQTNSGTTNNSTYAIDIQAIPGCTQPGSTVVFTASSGASGTYRAQQTGTIPDIPGTAVHLDLTFQLPPTPTPAATRAATPPPPPPPVATTARPSTPAPPPPSTATPRPATPVSTPRVQAPRVQAPKGPVTAQAPKAAGGAAPTYQAPAAVGGGAPAYQAPATAPRLPNTGTGGLLDQQSSTSLTGWALAAIVLAALGVSATGLMAYRRSR